MTNAYIRIYIYIWVASAFLFGLHHVRQVQGETKLRNDVLFFPERTRSGPIKTTNQQRRLLE